MVAGGGTRSLVGAIGPRLPASQGPVDTLDMSTWLSPEIARHQRRISERINGEFQPVAIHANRADHLLIWSQIRVLIVRDERLSGLVILNPRHVAGGARNTRAWWQIARNLRLPKLMMRAAFIGGRVVIGVARGASFNCRPLRVLGVWSMTGAAG